MKKINQKIGIIGGGIMGKTIAKALLDKKLANKKQILVCDSNKKQRRSLKQLGIQATANLDQLLNFSQIIILAVKPQSFIKLRKKIKGKLKKDQLIISIMAGVGITALKKLGTDQIVRSMPNTPALISEGMTVWTAALKLNKTKKDIAKKIFQSFGQEIEIKNKNNKTDKFIDAATAVSGSGPAYIFYFIEQLITAGKKLGFTEKESLKLATQTAVGAIRLLEKTKLPAKELRKKVTSKGGTTEVALKIFEKEKVGKNIIKGIKEANVKALELRKQTK